MKRCIHSVPIGITRYLLALLFIISPLILSAATPVTENYTDDNNIVYVLYDDNTAVLTNGKNPYLNANGEIRIASPITYNGQKYTVEKIADNAFTSSFPPQILSIKIDNGIKTIGAAAFKNLSKLKSIYLPESLESINGDVFDGCTSLSNIYCSGYTLPDVSGGKFTGIDLTKVSLFVSENYSDVYSADGSPFLSCKEIKEVRSSTLKSNRPEMIIDKSELTFTPGETKDLHISLDNSVNYLGFQVDLFLPEGLSIPETNGKYDVEIKSSTDGTTGDLPCKIEVKIVENGSYRMVAHPSTTAIFQPVTVITVKINTASDFREGEIWFRDLAASNSTTSVKAKDKSYLATIPEVLVESVSLNKTSVTLQATQTATLTATINPTNATKKQLTWSSSNPSVATVSAQGVVTAIAVGSTTVTATSVNGKTATCAVTVEATPATSVTIATPASTTLKPGEKLTLSASVLPALTTDKTVKWSSSDVAVATVNSEGVVSAKEGGDVVITAACGNVSDQINIKVLKMAKSLEINPSELSVEKGKEVILTAKYVPEDPDLIHLEWYSSDESIAVVDQTGKVSGITPGEVIISVSDKETGKTATCKITVTEIMYGDADNDGNIAINDVQLIVDYILERNPVTFVKDRADLDKDGIIDIFDVTKTLELVMSQTPESVSRAYASLNTRSPNDVLSAGVVKADEEDNIIVPLVLKTTDVYTGMQFDMALPQGWSVVDINTVGQNTARHTLVTAQLPDAITRVAVYSLSGTSLDSNGTLLEVKLRANDSAGSSSESYLSVNNTIASLATGQGIAIGDVISALRPVSGLEMISHSSECVVTPLPGGIKVSSPAGEKIEIYSLSGIPVISTISTGDDYFAVYNDFYIVIIGAYRFKIRVSQ